MLASRGKADFGRGAENGGAGRVVGSAARPLQVAARDELRQEHCIACRGMRHEVTRRKHRSNGLTDGGRRGCECSAPGIVELSKRTVNEGGQLGAHCFTGVPVKSRILLRDGCSPFTLRVISWGGFTGVWRRSRIRRRA